MRPTLWKWSKVALLPFLLLAAMYGVFWACAYALPNEMLVRLVAAAAAAAAGVAQADSMSNLSTPSGTFRLLNRLLFAAGWVAFSYGATGHFLNTRVGGNVHSSMQRNLAALRGSVASYHREHPGAFPTRLEDLVLSGATLRIPPAWRGSSNFGSRLLPHAATTGVEYYGNEACHGATNLHPVRDILRDTGRWGYVGDPRSACWGMVFIDCTHADSQGRPWADY